MSTETKTDRVLRDVLNGDNLRDLLSENVFDNAMRWRFLQAALYVLDGHGLLGDPADAVKEATPAPLDPSKVKAGDTVTVHVVTIDSPPYDVAGEAYLLGHALAVGGHVLTGPGVTLTAHTPAPEPEPEWEPEAIVRATVNGVPDTLLMRLTPGYEGGFVWATPTLTPRRPENEQSWLLYEDADITDVRPLVVIDPAAVDVDHLVDVGSNTDDPRTNTLAILAGLGLDGAS